jgi:two-component system sensor histidine kinase VicK
MAAEKDPIFKEIEHIGRVSHDGVFIYHVEQRRFLFVNKSMVNIVEIGQKVLMEEPDVLLKSLAQEDQEYLLTRFTELFEKGAVENVQIRVHEDKMPKILSFSGYLSADKSCVIGFVKDISKPKQHEDYLLAFGARKDAVLDTVAQNLITPLNLSNFTVDFIEKAVKEKKFNRLESHLAIMREVTAECIDIIGGLILQEHLESPGIHTKSNRFDLIEKLMVVVEKVKESNRDRRFRVSTDLKHLFINGDDLKFLQIVQNILSNSVKFTKPKGTIETVVKDGKASVKIIIRDNGIGIPKELQPFIFEKNTRAARPGLKGENSNGIALYVCLKLARLLGGNLSFESEEGAGATFILELPKD